MPVRRTVRDINRELEDASWDQEENGATDAIRAIVSKTTNSQLEKVVGYAAVDLNIALGEGADRACEIQENSITITGNMGGILHYRAILIELQNEIMQRGMRWMGYSREWERQGEARAV